ncbi:MAG: 3'-5' exonuclease [Cytophagales bacterium]
MNLNLKKPLVVFDLETTGTNIANDRIIEICLAKVSVTGQKEVWTQRVNPGMPIPEESSKIHGIYDRDVQDKPKFKEIAKKLFAFLEGCDLAGFNIVKFDVPMLVEEFLRADVDFDTSNRNLVDVQKIFHMMEPRNLSAAYRFYCEKELIDAHSAEADTLATLEILDRQVLKYQNKEVKDEKTGEVKIPIVNDMQALHKLTMSNNVDLAGRIVLNSNGVAVFNFGKHINKPVLDVMKTEPSYYDWMMKGDFPLDTKRKLTEIKLKQFNQK